MASYGSFSSSDIFVHAAPLGNREASACVRQTPRPIIARTPAKESRQVSCDTCAIKNLVYQYAHHIDSGDLEGVAAMFSEGKILAVGGLEHNVGLVVYGHFCFLS